jgi:hypothetical protein
MQQDHDHRPDGLPGEDPGDDVRRILAMASEVQLPPGAAERLMARIAGESQAGRAESPQSFMPRRRDGWRLAALPLAASLALGVILGAQGRLDFILPDAITGGDALNEDVLIDDLGGMGEADAAAEENLS